jgi:hypothetical protein
MLDHNDIERARCRLCGKRLPLEEMTRIDVGLYACDKDAGLVQSIHAASQEVAKWPRWMQNLREKR